MSAETESRAALLELDRLAAAYHRFLQDSDPTLKEEAGKELIRAIFGAEAIGDDAP